MYKLLATLITLLSASVFANAGEFQSEITLLSDDITYDVNQDGTFTVDEIQTLRINTEQAVKQHAQIALPYSTSLEDVEVLEAYTTAKDGRRIDVTSDKILVQQSPQSVGAPMFDDGKVKVVVYPAVEIGSSITLHSKKTQKVALFPGQFSMLEVGWANTEIKSERVTINAPASLHLNVDAVDMPGGQKPSVVPGRQVWQWSLSNTVARAPEAGMVAVTDYSPRVAVTTFPSYEAAAAAYLGRAKPKAAVTPELQKLADDITNGINDRRGQAEAIYRWVSQNIRYVAIFLNFGGVVPHDAQVIADAHYGDCKDHTTLLEALLAAKGIKSSPVLVNADASYWLPKVAITPGGFNHAITYLPEFHIFLDSTAGNAMFGVLPITEAGKQALVTDSGNGTAQLMRLPVPTPDHDQVSIKTKLHIDAEGNVSGSSEVANLGTFDWATRAIFASIPSGVETQVVSRFLSMSGQNGTGSYSLTNQRDISRPLTYTTTFALPNYVQLPGPGAMQIPTGFTSFSNIPSALESFASKGRELPLAFAGRKIVEDIDIQLPKAFSIPKLPANNEIHLADSSYVTSYRMIDNQVHIHRELELNVRTIPMNTDDYQKFRTLAVAISRDLRTQMLYQ